MTYETHRYKITKTSDHQLFEFSNLQGKVIGKAIYEWGRRPLDILVDFDHLYTVRQIRSD
ncbi:MAG: hypothetical protein KAJ19_17550 [Gammaproteobacteria bacterium]|nr:hypothetical protein [Gammaproteobacteria bacterium]